MPDTIQSKTFSLLICTQKNIHIRKCKIINLPVVLYELETWYSTVREEYRQSVREQGAEENIWTGEGWSDRWLEKAS
jgi:hypothetical protein